ncbi:hydrolase [Persicobacter diffluens]|uniref:Hydrolase n=2 Tax=Persicobacter diffluens TaxID=981 RepID=A0AAN4VVJ0_9BACT|nr:hydrolase [Persicobacter diffluens]
MDLIKIGALLMIFTISGVGYHRMTAVENEIASVHFNGDQFVNLSPTKAYSDYEYWPMLKAYWDADAQDRLPKIEIPVHELKAGDFDSIPADFSYTWLGHSSFLLEIEGNRLLFDPVLGDRASMLSFAGPKRMHESPISVTDLPALNGVVISHDHYDHLDKPTIQALAQGSQVHFYMPLEVGKHFRAWGVPEERIHEYDWWDAVQFGSVKMVCTPARHSSGRGLFDQNSTLWSSWSLIGEKYKVFYSGDTADMPEFADIVAQFGAFDISIFQVGAYNTLWEDAHILPSQALEANAVLGVKTMIPVHWATFDLALHPWDAPIKALYSAADQYSFFIRVPEIGESVDVAGLRNNSDWWNNELVKKAAS